MIDLTVQNGHRTILGTHPSQPILLLDVLVSINKTQVTFLDIFPWLTQRFYLLIEAELGLSFELFILLAGDGSLVVELMKLF